MEIAVSVDIDIQSVLVEETAIKAHTKTQKSWDLLLI